MFYAYSGVSFPISTLENLQGKRGDLISNQVYLVFVAIKGFFLTVSGSVGYHPIRLDKCVSLSVFRPSRLVHPSLRKLQNEIVRRKHSTCTVKTLEQNSESNNKFF